MPLDPKLDVQYFMKNHVRLLKFITFVKENPELTDDDLQSVSIQKKITRSGLGLRDSYTLSAMACLPNFVACFGGINSFRTAPLEMIAGHRASAAYVALSMEDVQYIPGKCPYYKCSRAAADKLYKRLFDMRENDMISEESTRAMQNVLQSKNYCQDYFDLKENQLERTWSDEELLTRVREFIQQQALFLKNEAKKMKNLSRNVENDGQTSKTSLSCESTCTREHQSMSPVSSLNKSFGIQCTMMNQHKDKCSQVSDGDFIQTLNEEGARDDEDSDNGGIAVEGAASSLNSFEDQPGMTDLLQSKQSGAKYRKGRKVDENIPVSRVSRRTRRAPKKLELYYC